ncbi:hypothetical protein LguiB_027562 [Lonicera macranthoides]
MRENTSKSLFPKLLYDRPHSAPSFTDERFFEPSDDAPLDNFLREVAGILKKYVVREIALKGKESTVSSKKSPDFAMYTIYFMERVMTNSFRFDGIDKDLMKMMQKRAKIAYQLLCWGNLVS